MNLVEKISDGIIEVGFNLFLYFFAFLTFIGITTTSLYIIYETTKNLQRVSIYWIAMWFLPIIYYLRKRYLKGVENK